LTDESVLQLQECLEQYVSFAILLTTEFPLCHRLRDFCLEIPVASPEDRLLLQYTTNAFLTQKDVWLMYVEDALERWSTTETTKCIVDLRNWIYSCLQRNLRWTDVMMYWVEAVCRATWMGSRERQAMFSILSRAESGAGWVLVTSYRIPILWEHVHLQIARQLYVLRQAIPSSSSLSPSLPSSPSLASSPSLPS